MMMKRNAEASFLLMAWPQDVKQEDDSSSHINRLPDELLLLIFNKMVDARCLCKCTLVSKRFSALIPLIHSDVSLIVPPPPDFSTISRDHHPNQQLQDGFVGFLVDSFFYRPFRFVQLAINTSKCLPRQFNGQFFRAAVESLKKFRNMPWLRIQIPPVQRRQDSLLRWQDEFGNDTNICVILFASSVLRLTDEEYHSNYDDQEEAEGAAEMFNGMTDQLLRKRIASANQCFLEATWRNHILRHVVEDHPWMLKSAEITDTEGVGSLIICSKEKKRGHDSDDGQTLKEQQHDVEEEELPKSGYAKVWHLPELRICPRMNDDDDDDDDDGLYIQMKMEGVSMFAIRQTDEVPEADEQRLSSLMDQLLPRPNNFQYGSSDHHHHHHHHHDDDIVVVYKEILKRIRYENNDHVPPITLDLNVRQ